MMSSGASSTAAHLGTRRRLLRALPALPLMMPARPVHAASALRIGLTPVFLDDQIGFLERWRHYLEQRLARPVRFVQRGSYSEVLRLLLEGGSEFAWLCGFPYWRYRHRLELIATPVYHGKPLYQAYLIRSRAHPELTTLEQLRGKVFAYSDPDSNSGFLYVRNRLREAGRIPEQHFGRSFYTWAHRRVVEAVALQLAHAGAVDGYVWEVLARLHPELSSATEIIEHSPEFGFPPIVAAPGSTATERRLMRTVLTTMQQDAEGMSLLQTLFLDGFEATLPALYASIGRMAEQE